MRARRWNAYLLGQPAEVEREMKGETRSWLCAARGSRMPMLSPVPRNHGSQVQKTEVEIKKKI